MNAHFTEITRIEHLLNVISRSKDAPILFFKHSIVCPVSKRAFRDLGTLEEDIFIIVVQESRGVSDELSRISCVRHQSPQVIILCDEKPVFDASHSMVIAEDVKNRLDELRGA
ncbi:MAG: monothiol bacilliredoxin BrxC family protein [Pyrinomonadaceae bacterium]